MPFVPGRVLATLVASTLCVSTAYANVATCDVDVDAATFGDAAVCFAPAPSAGADRDEDARGARYTPVLQGAFCPTTDGGMQLLIASARVEPASCDDSSGS